MSGDQKNKRVEYCAITEQGDLGLGADVLNEADQKIMNRNGEKSDSKNKQDTSKLQDKRNAR